MKKTEKIFVWKSIWYVCYCVLCAVQSRKFNISKLLIAYLLNGWIEYIFTTSCSLRCILLRVLFHCGSACSCVLLRTNFFLQIKLEIIDTRLRSTRSFSKYGNTFRSLNAHFLLFAFISYPVDSWKSKLRIFATNFFEFRRQTYCRNHNFLHFVEKNISLYRREGIFFFEKHYWLIQTFASDSFISCEPLYITLDSRREDCDRF